MDKSFASKQIRASGWLEWGDPESVGSPVLFNDAVSGPDSHDDPARLGADGGGVGRLSLRKAGASGVVTTLSWHLRALDTSRFT